MARKALQENSRVAKGKLKKWLYSAFLSFALILFIPNTGLAVGKGAHGPDIFVIQGMLKSLGSYSGQIHGHYDELTVRGVKHFQKKHGLPVTGSVDKRTFQSIVYSYDHVKWVLHAVKAEEQAKAKKEARVKAKDKTATTVVLVTETVMATAHLAKIMVMAMADQAKTTEMATATVRQAKIMAQAMRTTKAQEKINRIDQKRFVSLKGQAFFCL